MVMFCVEFENTADGSLNGKVVNRQLIFTRHLAPYQREHLRWVEYDPENLEYADVGVKRLWEKKHHVPMKWEKWKDDAGQERYAWIIQEVDVPCPKPLNTDKAANFLNRYFAGMKF